MNFFLSLILACLLFYSCQRTPIDLGKATKFFPSSTQLQEGIAFKYYEHNNPANKDASFSINIGYRTYQFFQPNTLVIDYYDAGFRLYEHNVFEVNEENFKMIEKKYYLQKDTLQAEILNPVTIDWADENAVSKYKFVLDGYQAIYSNNQHTLTDTSIDGRISKVIRSATNIQSISPTNDTTYIEGTTTSIFAEGLGLIKQNDSEAEMSIESELVEQMSLKEFKKRANHGKKRIAYIDPKSTIDNNSNFTLCNQEVEIKDYYNCSDHARLKGGKGRWWRIIEKELDSKKLKKESGYLTYRFVLNCKDELGRFITEEADLDFNKKQFNQETVDHLYQIVSRQKDWQTCFIKSRNKQFDAYLYLTFKLKDGKIIEILP